MRVTKTGENTPNILEGLTSGDISLVDPQLSESTGDQEYAIAILATQARLELEAISGELPDSEYALLKNGLESSIRDAYRAVGTTAYQQLLSRLRVAVANIDHHYEGGDEYEKRRNNLANHVIAEHAEEEIERKQRQAALYRKLDDAAKIRVAVLSQAVNVKDDAAVTQYAQAVVDSVAGPETPKAVREAQAQRTASYLQKNPAAIEVHNAISKEARLESSILYEARMQELRIELQRNDISDERRALLERILDRGTASAMVANNSIANGADAPISLMKNNELQQLCDVQKTQMQRAAGNAWQQISTIEQHLLGSPQQAVQFLDQRDKINRLLEQNTADKQLVFDASVKLIQGENVADIPENILKDAAVINYTSLLISTNIVENLTSGALALDPRYQTMFKLKGEERVEAITALLKQQNPALEKVPDDQLRIIVNNTLARVDTVKEAGAALTLLTQSQRDTIAATAALDSVLQVREEIQEASEAIRDAGQNSSRRKERYRDGKSFIELEFEDVAGVINQNDPRLARRLGGADHKFEAEEILNILEEAGVIDKWSQTENHRISTMQAVAGKLGFGVGADFRDWNEESIKRLDVNGDGQLSGQEAWDALRLVDYMKQNPEVVAAVTEHFKDPNFRPIHAGFDINKDGKLDEVEVARVLMDKGISNPQDVDTSLELSQLLSNAAALTQQQENAKAKTR